MGTEARRKPRAIDRLGSFEDPLRRAKQRRFEHADRTFPAVSIRDCEARLRDGKPVYSVRRLDEDTVEAMCWETACGCWRRRQTSRVLSDNEPVARHNSTGRNDSVTRHEVQGVHVWRQNARQSNDHELRIGLGSPELLGCHVEGEACALDALDLYLQPSLTLGEEQVVAHAVSLDRRATQLAEEAGWRVIRLWEALNAAGARTVDVPGRSPSPIGDHPVLAGQRSR
jgi:hypothetical protein